MPYDEPADLVASCEATLDTIALLLGDISEEVQDRTGAWTIAEVLNHLVDAERRQFSRVPRLRREKNAQMKVQPDRDVTPDDRAPGLEAFLRAPATPRPSAALAQAR